MELQFCQVLLCVVWGLSGKVKEYQKISECRVVH